MNANMRNFTVGAATAVALTLTAPAQATPLTPAHSPDRIFALSMLKEWNAKPANDISSYTNLPHARELAKEVRAALIAERNTFSRIDKSFDISHYINVGGRGSNGHPERAEDFFTAYNSYSGRGNGWGHIKHNGEDYGQGNGGGYGYGHGGGNGYDNGGNPGASPVPEPATILFFATGVAGLAAVGRRKPKAKAENPAPV